MTKSKDDAKLDKEVAAVEKKSSDKNGKEPQPTNEIPVPPPKPKMTLRKRIRLKWKVLKSWLLSEPDGPQDLYDSDEEEKKEKKVEAKANDDHIMVDDDGNDIILTKWDVFKMKISSILNFNIDPSKNFFYWWSALVSLFCFYNLIMVIARVAFDDFQKFWQTWLAIDFASDIVFLLDMVVSSRKIFLENGEVIHHPRQLLRKYRKSMQFVSDLVSVLPTELLYYWYPLEPWVRFNRLLRCYRFNDFVDRTEMRTSWPNLFRVLKLLATIFTMFHWNACLFFTLSKFYGPNVPGTSEWQFQYEKIRQYVVPNCDAFQNADACDYVPMHVSNVSSVTTGDQELDEMVIMDDLDAYYHWLNNSRTIEFSNLTRQYVFSLYWSALILTTIGEQVPPILNSQFLFVIADILLGLLIFATIVGNVGEMVTNMNAAKAAFEEQMDGVKQYMEHRKVNPKLQKRIIKWFRYIWTQGQTLDEDEIIHELPPKLQAEIAMTLHLNTLKRDCEPGLLVELVQKLKLQVFSPGDYICRRGDVGKEMYIVKRGSLNVVAPDGIKVFVTLKEGAVFGELSIMDIAGNKNGNRRTAGVRSVGFSDLFVLSKDDLWDALREYPEGKRSLLAKGRDILRKDNILDESVPQLETGPTKTVDQKLDHTQAQMEHLSESITKLYAQFAADTARNKQRVTHLEKLLKKKREEQQRKIEEEKEK